MNRDEQIEVFTELVESWDDAVENGLIVDEGDDLGPALGPRATQALAALKADVAPRTCATCGSRLASASCDLDVLDPQGEYVTGDEMKNWKNRDTFTCGAWDERQGGQ